jgi:ankyrin repeat protein
MTKRWLAFTGAFLFTASVAQADVAPGDLFSACEKGDAEAAVRIVHAGVDAKARDTTGNTALHYAARSYNRALIDWLVKSGVKIGLTNAQGRTALHEAAALANLSAASALIGNHANLESRTAKGDTPLHLAAQSLSAEAVKIIEFFLESGANVNSTNFQGETPFFLSCEAAFPDTELLDARIEKGGEAVPRDSLAVPAFLISSGADLQIRNVDGETALFRAAALGKSRLMKFLVETGANVNVTNRIGVTILETAKRKGDDESVRLLLDAGAR